MRKSKIKLIKEELSQDPIEIRIRAFYAGFDQGWKACEEEQRRDAFFARLQERQKMYEAYANKQKTEEKTDAN